MFTQAVQHAFVPVTDRIEELTSFGPIADRPDASGMATFYFATDIGVLYFDAINPSGSAYWEMLGSRITTLTAATLTLDDTHGTVLCDASSNAVTATLPSAVGIQGKIYRIKCIDLTNAVQVATTGGQTIDGSATPIALALMQVITVQSDGANWWIIAN